MPFRVRAVALNRLSKSRAFHAFHTTGLVPRISATVSKYKAFKRLSLLTKSANFSMTLGSDKSVFCAVLDITKCVSTNQATNSASAFGKPCDLQKRRASKVPSVE